MIQLTRTEGPIWVNPAHIVSLEHASSGGTWISLSVDSVEGLLVQESPGEILHRLEA